MGTEALNEYFQFTLSLNLYPILAVPRPSSIKIAPIRPPFLS